MATASIGGGLHVPPIGRVKSRKTNMEISSMCIERTSIIYLIWSKRFGNRCKRRVIIHIVIQNMLLGLISNTFFFFCSDAMSRMYTNGI